MASRDFDQLALLGADFLPTTPVRRQYLELKARHPDAILFFRLGDFYETFDDDARLVADALDIVLTGREMGRGERIPMAGVPYQAAEGYIARLIERGHRVALCDQVGEVPARGLVRREVVRVVSPGTLVEDGLLPQRANNFLAAIVPERGGAGLAYVDVSTGQLGTTEVSGPAWRPLLGAELVRLGPAECLVSAERDADADGLDDLLPPGARPTPRPAAAFAPHRAVERLRRHFKTGALGSLGLDERPLAARAVAALLEYVEETLPAAVELLDRVEVYAVEGSMVLDAATRRSLELTEGLRSGGRRGSLLEAIDATGTPMGARMLRRWLTRPLLDPEQIAARHDAVAWLVDHREARARLTEALAKLPDLERLAGRAAQRILNPREALALAAGARLLPTLVDALAPDPAPLLADLRAQIGDFRALADRVERTVESPPPANFGEGIIKSDCCPELDETRALAGDTRAWIADLERRERERTGVRGLKVGYNRVFGYYFEVSKATLAQPTDYYQRETSGVGTVGEHLDRLGYARRQTLANAERLVSAELQEYELKVRNAQEAVVRLERQAFAELVSEAAAVARPLLDSACAAAGLDVLAGFAETAVRRGYCRPELVATNPADPPARDHDALADVDGRRTLDGRLDAGGAGAADVLEVVGGRHPVVEAALGEGAFVPNDTHLGGDGAVVAILTGPNMAGKSTYLRQVALIVLLAQVGSYVPADRLRFGVVDRVFARVGAQDDLAARRSTFMVEMIETANILRNASPRSLLVLDEIGRGTSTFDGIAVARAVVEHIHDSPRLGCKTLFATHYHELAELADSLERVASLQMEVLERGEDVVFLHHVAPGAADRSYGVHVARLAGVPEPVTRRAAQILVELEQGRDVSVTPAPVPNGHPSPPAAPAVPRAGPEATAPPPGRNGHHPAVRRLRRLDPLNLTPMQALAELEALAHLAAEDA